jgi:hypothetical protein
MQLRYHDRTDQGGVGTSSQARAYSAGGLADDQPGKTVGWVLARLVCQECGRPPAVAVLVRRVGLARPRAARIGLVGNGA